MLLKLVLIFGIAANVAYSQRYFNGYTSYQRQPTTYTTTANSYPSSYTSASRNNIVTSYPSTTWTSNIQNGQRPAHTQYIQSNGGSASATGQNTFVQSGGVSSTIIGQRPNQFVQMSNGQSFTPVNSQSQIFSARPQFVQATGGQSTNTGNLQTGLNAFLQSGGAAATMIGQRPNQIVQMSSGQSFTPGQIFQTGSVRPQFSQATGGQSTSTGNLQTGLNAFVQSGGAVATMIGQRPNQFVQMNSGQSFTPGQILQTGSARPQILQPVTITEILPTGQNTFGQSGGTALPMIGQRPLNTQFVQMSSGQSFIQGNGQSQILQAGSTIPQFVQATGGPSMSTGILPTGQNTFVQSGGAALPIIGQTPVNTQFVQTSSGQPFMPVNSQSQIPQAGSAVSPLMQATGGQSVNTGILPTGQNTFVQSGGAALPIIGQTPVNTQFVQTSSGQPFIPVNSQSQIPEAGSAVPPLVQATGGQSMNTGITQAIPPVELGPATIQQNSVQNAQSSRLATEEERIRREREEDRIRDEKRRAEDIAYEEKRRREEKEFEEKLKQEDEAFRKQMEIDDKRMIEEMEASRRENEQQRAVFAERMQMLIQQQLMQVQQNQIQQAQMTQRPRQRPHDGQIQEEPSNQRPTEMQHSNNHVHQQHQNAVNSNPQAQSQQPNTQHHQNSVTQTVHPTSNKQHELNKQNTQHQQKSVTQTVHPTSNKQHELNQHGTALTHQTQTSQVIKDEHKHQQGPGNGQKKEDGSVTKNVQVPLKKEELKNEVHKKEEHKQAEAHKDEGHKKEQAESHKNEHGKKGENWQWQTVTQTVKVPHKQTEVKKEEHKHVEAKKEEHKHAEAHKSDNVKKEGEKGWHHETVTKTVQVPRTEHMKEEHKQVGVHKQGEGKKEEPKQVEVHKSDNGKKEGEKGWHYATVTKTVQVPRTQASKEEHKQILHKP